MRWIVLSDLHYAFGQSDPESLRTSLLEVVEDLKPIDFVLVTGDLMNRHVADDGLAAFFVRLRRACGNIGRDRVHVTCSNHDVDRGEAGRRALVRRLQDSDGQLEHDEVAQLESLGYEAFERLCSEVSSNRFLHFSARKFECPDGSYRVVSLNSELLSEDGDDGRLKIMSPAMSRLREDISDDDALNIVIMHHGCSCFAEEERRRFQHWCDDARIDVVFCGDAHKPGFDTYGETRGQVREFTVGCAVPNSVCAPGGDPAFYFCEYGPASCSLDVTLYTYALNTESWVRGTGLFRSFSGGTNRHVVERLYRKGPASRQPQLLSSYAVAESVSRVIAKLDDDFRTNFGKRVHSVRSKRDRDFSTDQILHSLVHVGVPLDVALTVVEKTVSRLVAARNEIDEPVDTRMICELVFQTLSAVPVGAGVTVYLLKRWSSRYARRYKQEESSFFLLEEGEKRHLTYSYMEGELAAEVMERALGGPCGEARLVLGRSEWARMSDALVRYLDEIDSTELHRDVAVSFLADLVSNPPHPWCCRDDQRARLIAYNGERLCQHLEEPGGGGSDAVLYPEVVYHASSVFMLCAGSVLGSTDVAPLRMLRLALKSQKRGERYDALRKMSAPVMAAAEAAGVPWEELVDEVDHTYRVLEDNVLSIAQINGDSMVRKFGRHAMMVAGRVREDPTLLQGLPEVRSGAAAQREEL